MASKMGEYDDSIKKKKKFETKTADFIVDTIDSVMNIFTKEEEAQSTDQYGGSDFASSRKRAKATGSGWKK